MTAAIGPILLLLALGRLVRQRVVNDPGFWRGLEILNYRIYTPALFVTSISGTEFTNVPIAALVLGLSAPVVGATLLVLALKQALRVDSPRLTSLVQGSIRQNGSAARMGDRLG